MSFLDQQMTSDGRPYGPIRHKQLFEYCFYISKQSNNRVEEIKDWTPLELKYAMDYLDEVNKAQDEAFQKQFNKNKK